MAVNYITTNEEIKMKKLNAFLLGMKEFRSMVTTSYNDLDLLDAYDHGRDLAHKLTLRKFEDV